MNLPVRSASDARPGLPLPEAPALVAGSGRAVLLDPDGVFEALPVAEAARRLHRLAPPLVVHAPATFRRLGIPRLPAYDLLELFAFVLPAHPAAPSPRGLALALAEDPPEPGLEAAAALLPRLAAALLGRLAASRAMPGSERAAALAALMGKAGWGWAPFVMVALGRPTEPPSPEGLRAWRRLPEWEEKARSPSGEEIGRAHV